MTRNTGDAEGSFEATGCVGELHSAADVIPVVLYMVAWIACATMQGFWVDSVHRGSLKLDIPYTG